MILSSLYDSKRYHSLHPLFRRAFEFYDTTGRFMDDGRHTVDGDNIIMTISECDLRCIDEAPLEAHNEYIDIQIVMSGNETYGVADRSECKNPKGEYDAKHDIEFYDDTFQNQIKLTDGDFVIFFPEDAHAPLIGSGKVKKAIFKIKNEETI